ncbi:NUDIX domain-containing protein [Psychroflexus aestuariivivens]|uniref:NUDIX domain-containing protein n=1 Tax=Psychroflexus aestuariivivens TaxID=1795040 RepID=UPI000FDA517C|nr:NUDIX hydrolase [Psychroflexus aestuariivivens]
MNQEIKVTADAVVFCKNDEGTKILLIKRKNEPYKGSFAFPGGFVDNHELVINACQRELKEETGLSIDVNEFNFIDYYDQPDRDPRSRTITFAFAAVISEEKFVEGSDDAAEAEWIDLEKISNLAFDHKNILEKAKQKIFNL